jgi:hypothetical protein
VREIHDTDDVFCFLLSYIYCWASRRRILDAEGPRITYIRCSQT